MEPACDDWWIVVDERGRAPVVAREMVVDKVWPGHPVGFCLLTAGTRQYVAYYTSRGLGEDEWIRFLPQTGYGHPPKTGSPASTVLGWDSHNYATLALDAEGFIHLSVYMHVNRLTYFRSTRPHDIASLAQVESMTGRQEDRCTYPQFMEDGLGNLVFAYRHGSSGRGNQIFNRYDTATREWSRLLDTPLTDGEGLRNAYLIGPLLGPDGWYHVSRVWRETYDCSTNHDLCYAKSRVPAGLLRAGRRRPAGNHAANTEST